MRARIAMGGLAVVVLCGGCTQNFDPAWLLKDDRVLAAHVEVDGDPTVAEPAPSQTVDVQWFVSGPDVPHPVTWFFAWCPEAPIIFGQPICEPGTQPTFDTPQTTPTTAAPSLSFTVPDAQSLGDSTSILVTGVVCVDGIVVTDPQVFENANALGDACQGVDARAEPVRLTVPITLDGATNHNPEISVVLLGGALWPEPTASVLTASSAGCPDSSLPQVTAGDDALRIDIDTTTQSRETYQATDVNNQTTTQIERLQVMHLTTAGEMNSRFSFIDQPGQVAATTAWLPPAATDLTSDPQLVRFPIVVTDGRAGTTTTTRALCVRGPAPTP